MAKNLGGVSGNQAVKKMWGPTPKPPKHDPSQPSINPGTFKEPGGSSGKTYGT